MFHFSSMLPCTAACYRIPVSIKEGEKIGQVRVNLNKNKPDFDPELQLLLAVNSVSHLYYSHKFFLKKT